MDQQTIIDQQVIIEQQQQAIAEAEKPKKKKKKKDSSRSVETMFRTTLSSHVQLSNIADGKAGMMISVNAIVLSIVVSLAINHQTKITNLLWPTLFLAVVCLATIVVSVIATKPSVGPPNSSNTPIDLLFFGSYTQIDLQDYQLQMTELITKDEAVKEQMITNIYAQGLVLKRKYARLKTAYTVFMIGFPLAILFYIATFWGLF